MYKKPNIFIISEIDIIFGNAIEELESIKQYLTTTTNEHQWMLQSLYVHIYSIFESTLYKSLYKILLAFPNNIKDIKKEYINDSIRDYLTSYSLMTPLVEVIVSSFTRDFAYEKIENTLKRYNDIVQIWWNIKKCPHIHELKEYKLERNNIVHQGTIPNNLNHTKIIEKINLIHSILNEIKDKFDSKYNQYTKQHLIEKSWYYVFGNAIPFNCCFTLNNNSYVINAEFIKNRTKTLSSSEKMLFLLFLTNYNSAVLENRIKIKDLCTFASLTNTTKNKIGYILELFERVPTLLQDM